MSQLHIDAARFPWGGQPFLDVVREVRAFADACPKLTDPHGVPFQSVPTPFQMRVPDGLRKLSCPAFLNAQARAMRRGEFAARQLAYLFQHVWHDQSKVPGVPAACLLSFREANGSWYSTPDGSEMRPEHIVSPRLSSDLSELDGHALGLYFALGKGLYGEVGRRLEKAEADFRGKNPDRPPRVYVHYTRPQLFLRREGYMLDGFAWLDLAGGVGPLEDEATQ